MNPITRAAELKLVALDDSWWKNPEIITDKISPLPNHFVNNTVFKVIYKIKKIVLSKNVITEHLKKFQMS